MRSPPEGIRSLLQGITPHIILFVPYDPLGLFTRNENPRQPFQIIKRMHRIREFATARTVRIDSGRSGRRRRGEELGVHFFEADSEGASGVVTGGGGRGGGECEAGEGGVYG